MSSGAKLEFPFLETFACSSSKSVTSLYWFSKYVCPKVYNFDKLIVNFNRLISSVHSQCIVAIGRCMRDENSYYLNITKVTDHRTERHTMENHITTCQYILKQQSCKGVQLKFKFKFSNRHNIQLMDIPHKKEQLKIFLNIRVARFAN